MARKQTPEALRDKARKIMEKAKAIEKQERQKIKKEEEERTKEIGILILKYRGEGYKDFVLSEFREEVEKIIGNGTTEPVNSDAIKMTVPKVEEDAA